MEEDNHPYMEEDTVSDSEDGLSLCDLSFTDNNNPQATLLCPNDSPSEEEKDEDDPFHFATNPNPSSISPIHSLLLFRKSTPQIKASNVQYTKEEEEQRQRSRISLFRSDSFNKFSSFRRDSVKTQKFIADYYGRSDSGRLTNKNDSSSTVIGSVSSRKYKALIGPTKLPAKIELIEIRRRQSRLPPVPMFPAIRNVIGGKSLWGLLRPLRSRSRPISLLA